MMNSEGISESVNLERYRPYLPTIVEMIDYATRDGDFVLAAKLQACFDHINEVYELS